MQVSPLQLECLPELSHKLSLVFKFSHLKIYGVVELLLDFRSLGFRKTS